MSPGVQLVLPKFCPPGAYISCTRLLSASAMKTSPALSSVTQAAWLSSDDDGAPPSPESPDAPDELPATVYMSPPVMAMPHCVPELAGTSSIRLLLVSAMY